MSTIEYVCVYKKGLGDVCCSLPDKEDIENKETNVRELSLLQTLNSKYTIPESLFMGYSGVQEFIMEDGIRVIVKFEKKEQSGADFMFKHTIHEAFIGLFGLNSLKSSIFARIIQFSMTENYYYVIYEHISGPLFRKYLETAPPEAVKSIMLKILNGLYTAHNSIQFTHYDIHADNIIIRNDEPVIIDYGVSSMKYDGIDYGSGYADVNRFKHHMWYHDTFSLLFRLAKGLMSILESPDFILHEIILICQKLLQFFIVESFDLNYIERYIRKYTYSQPPNEIIGCKYNFDEFMKLAHQYLDDSIQRTQSEPEQSSS